MVPPDTVLYYLGSWEKALKQAGLEKKKRKELIMDVDLLKDLLRLYKENGVIPTFPLIEAKSKYSKDDYLGRWNSSFKRW